MQFLKLLVRQIVNILAATIVAIEFVLSFAIVFFPLHLLNYLLFFFPQKRERVAQFLNHLHNKWLFSTMQLIIPKLNFEVDEDVLKLRSSIIIANHTSYLDSIFFISLFSKQKSIFKKSLFYVPFIGMMMRSSGYIPSSASFYNNRILESIQKLPEFLGSGGNIFVFPEGTRSKNGEVAAFQPGVFKLAKKCKTAITAVRIENMHQLFKPGTFWLNVFIKDKITVKKIKTITPDYKSKDFSLNNLIRQSRELYL